MSADGVNTGADVYSYDAQGNLMASGDAQEMTSQAMKPEGVVDTQSYTTAGYDATQPHPGDEQPLVGGENNLVYDPSTGQYMYDPNQQPYDPNQQPYDPNQQQYVDPNQQQYVDPNQQYAYDPNSGYMQQYDAAGNPITAEFYGADGQPLPQPGMMGGEQMGDEYIPQGGDAPGPQTPEEIELARRKALIRAAFTYEPTGNYWIADVSTEIFVSMPFRWYLTYQLYTVMIIFLFVGFDWSFGMFFRMFHGPDQDKSQFGQALAQFTMFILLSYVVVTFECCIMDMAKDVWAARSSDTKLWAIGISKKHSPWALHAAIILITFIVPIFWAFIAAIADGHSVFYFIQYFCFISTLLTIFVVLIVFWWMNALSYRNKTRAYEERNTVEDCEDIPADDEEHRMSWYQYETLMEEYGLDTMTIKWYVIVYVVGLVPIFSTLAALTQDGRTAKISVEWLIIAILMFCIMLMLQQLGTWKHKYRASIAAIFCIALFYLVTIIAIAVWGNGAEFFIMYAVFLIMVQWLVLPKRAHQLTMREIHNLYGVPYKYQKGAEEIQKLALQGIQATEPEEEPLPLPECDSYLCIWKMTVLTCMKCFDVRSVFGFKHPDIAKKEKELARERFGLRTDQRFLMLYWVAITIMLFVVLGMMRSVFVEFGSASVAARTGIASPASNPYPICNVSWNGNSSNKMLITDLAMLATLSYSWGTQFDKDLAILFSHYPSLVRVSPTKLPSNLEDAQSHPYVYWTTLRDTQTNLTVVLVRCLNRGVAWLRNFEMWGDSFALQTSSLLAPHMSLWLNSHKNNFADGMNFFKGWMGKNNGTTGIENQLLQLVKAGFGPKMVIVGHGFNGGIAQILGSIWRIRSVAFNSPGTAWISDRFGIQENSDKNLVVRSDDLYAWLDDIDGNALVQFLPCQEKTAKKCSDVRHTTMQLIESCGDPYGRSVG